MRDYRRRMSIAALALSAFLAACAKKNESVTELNLKGRSDATSTSAADAQPAVNPSQTVNSALPAGGDAGAVTPPLDLAGLKNLRLGGTIPTIGDVQVSISTDGKIIVDQVSKDASGKVTTIRLLEVNKPEVVASLSEQLKTTLTQLPQLIKPFIPNSGSATSMTLEVNGQKYSVDLNSTGNAAKQIFDVYTKILAQVGAAILAPK